MLSTYRRHVLVVAFLIVAGLAGVAASPRSYTLALPSLTPALSAGGWRVLNQEQPVAYTGMRYQVSTLYDTRGHQAQLYVGAASLQKMIHWSGELGFEGAGYQMSRRATINVRLADGTSAPASMIVEQRLSDRELALYAIVGPDGVAARSSDNLVSAAWNVVRGNDGPYYVVRVAVADLADDMSARAVAARLLGPVLSRLIAAERASQQSRSVKDS